MKIRIEADMLIEALAAVAPAVARQGTAYAALQGVRFEATASGVTVQASDLDLTITRQVPGDVAGAGSVLVPHRLLAAVVGRLDGAVELTVEDDVLLVRAGHRTAELRTLRDAGWPCFPPVAAEAVVVSPEDRTTLHRLCAFAGTDPSRPVLNGVRVVDGLAVATDSYRLGVQPVDCRVDALLPASLLAAVGPGDGPLTLLVGPIAVEVHAGLTVWRVATVEGAHLPLRSVEALTRCGATDPLAVTADRAELLDALALAAVTADRGSDTVRLRVGDGTLELSGTGDGSATSVVLDADTLGSIEMGFNWRYLRDLLRACQGGQITLTMVDPARPCRVIDGDLMAVVMPVRLADASPAPPR